jgi:hypothetical protein
MERQAAKTFMTAKAADDGAYAPLRWLLTSIIQAHSGSIVFHLA